MLELAKCLKLVAPISMSADAQLVWLQAAVDALEGIHANEVAAISAELRRSVTRPSQIVPEIARLVDEKRKRPAYRSDAPISREWAINGEAEKRRKSARTQSEIEAAWAWERQARIEAGLYVQPHQPPLNLAELKAMPAHVRDLGLARGLLEYCDGQLRETVL